MNRKLWMVVAIVVILSLLAVSGVHAQQKVRLSQGQNGTTLSAEKTADGYWDKTIEYDWAVMKDGEPEWQEIGAGATGTVSYTLTVTRMKVSERDVIGVRGMITVTNGGDVATQGLKLVDQVEYKTGAGQFQPLEGASQTIIPDTQLMPGETRTFEYNIQFTPIPSALYRNTVKVTITNHSGHLGEEFGPEPKASFSLPAEPTIIEIDEEAEVTDTLTCPAGFTCTPASFGPWKFTASGEKKYSVQVKNVSAQCEKTVELVNSAKLTELDTNTLRGPVSDSVQISTGRCPPAGCTYTIGYWKNHPTHLARLLPITLGNKTVSTTSEAIKVLSMGWGDPSNGITKLYAQLLAAKLNIKNGADGSAVASVIAQADSFLMTHDWTHWKNLTKAEQQMVLSWMSRLDSYNNGYIGPGHCG